MNNGFLFTSEVIFQWFSRVTKSRVKIIGKSHHEWTKTSLFTATNVLFYLLHAILCLEHTIQQKNYGSFISPLSPWKIFSDLALGRHHSWSVKSSECEVSALWRHISRLFLHAQSLACKKGMFRLLAPNQCWQMIEKSIICLWHQASMS